MATRSAKYFVTHKGKQGSAPTPVEVETLGTGRYAVTLNGQRHEVDSLVLPHSAVSMLIDGHSSAVEFEQVGDELAVQLKGQTTRFDVADERKLRLRAAAVGLGTEARHVMLAPMPGKVIKVFVKLGDEVTEGQGLVVVEAMKMENELKSPKAGKVTELLAVEGKAVENGARLLVVE